MTSLAYAALWIFVFALPWERAGALPGLNIVSSATGGLALGLTLFAVVISARVRRWRVFHVAALLFVIWAGIGVWVLLGANSMPKKFYTFVQLFAVLWMIWELALSAQRLRGLLTAFLLGAFVPALATIQLFVRKSGSLKRYSAWGADANNIAMTLALALPMAWYLSLTTERAVFRWVCRAYLPVGLLGIALTGSRGGMLASLVALLVIPLTMKLSPGRIMAAVVFLGLSGVVVATYVPDRTVERLASTGQQLEGGTLGGRLQIWMAGVHAFTQRPLMGYGTSQFIQAITPELGSKALVAHNSFLSVLVEEGLVGLTLYMTMLLSVFYYVLHFPPLERRFGLILLATLATAMLPLAWEEKKVVWFVMAALVGMSGLKARTETVRQPLPHRAVPIGRSSMAARSAQRAASVGPGLDEGPAA